MKLRNELCVLIILGFLGLTVFLFVNGGKTPTATPAIQSESSAPPSEEAVLRATMCNAIKDAVREYAAHVPAPGVSISDRNTAIHVMYMLCMMQAPR